MITLVASGGGCGGFIIPHWFFVTEVWLWFKELCKLLELGNVLRNGRRHGSNQD